MELNNVEIFASGTWNGFKFVDQDLNEIVTNTNNLISKSTHKPPLKLGHSTNQVLDKQTDGDPALGWINNLNLQDNKIIADFKDIPKIVMEAIEKGLYKKISVEMKHIDHTGWIITAAALLGADLPAVKTIDDLQAFLSDTFIQDQVSPDSSTSLLFSEPNIITPVSTNDRKTEKTTNEETKMSDETKDISSEVLQEQAKLMSENTDLKAKIKAFETKEKELKFNEEKVSLLSQFKEDVKAGKLPPAMFEKLEAHFNSQKDAFFSDSKLMVTPDLMREVAGAYSQSLPQGEFSSNDKKEEIRADVALEKKIAETMTNTGKSYQECSDLVFNSNPELWEDYKNLTVKFSEGV